MERKKKKLTTLCYNTSLRFWLINTNLGFLGVDSISLLRLAHSTITRLCCSNSLKCCRIHVKSFNNVLLLKDLTYTWRTFLKNPSDKATIIVLTFDGYATMPLRSIYAAHGLLEPWHICLFERNFFNIIINTRSYVIWIFSMISIQYQFLDHCTCPSLYLYLYRVIFVLWFRVCLEELSVLFLQLIPHCKL